MEPGRGILGNGVTLAPVRPLPTGVVLVLTLDEYEFQDDATEMVWAEMERLQAFVLDGLQKGVVVRPVGVEIGWVDVRPQSQQPAQKVG